jgi:hypothetical protein
VLLPCRFLAQAQRHARNARQVYQMAFAPSPGNSELDLTCARD